MLTEYSRRHEVQPRVVVNDILINEHCGPHKVESFKSELVNIALLRFLHNYGNIGNEVGTIPNTFQITRALYSAQWHRQHCKLQTFEKLGALYMHYPDDKHPTQQQAWASTGQKYSSTSTSTWKNDEYKYKYKYWIFKSTWVQVQVLWKVLEYKYWVLW